MPQVRPNTAGKREFQFQVKGAGVTPQSVWASDLAAILTNLQGAIVEAAKAQDIPLAYHTDEVLVSLVRVESGASSDLTIAVASPLSPAVGIISRAISNRNYTIIPYDTHLHLYELYSHATKNHWSYEIRPADGLSIEPAVISYEYPVPAPSSGTVSGQSILWGHVNRVGGSSPKVSLRQRNGKLLSVSVTMDVITQIKERKLLYTDVGLIGTATWRVSDWELQTFTATELASYQPDEVNLEEAFQALRKASGGRWDNIDAASYVDELRSEE